MSALQELTTQVVTCRRCPRLVAWRERISREKRAAYHDQDYWGRPVPGFGDARARILLVGLAPAAHGGNRTGRVFTGDRSGDFLYAALHRAGLASRPVSTHRDDGLALRGAYLTAALRCAPPANRPTPAERDNCAPYLLEELQLLGCIRVEVALGAYAWDQLLRVHRVRGDAVPRPKPKFAHGTEASIGGRALLGAYHPSQQNTFTGRLRPEMLDAVLRRAVALAAD